MNVPDAHASAKKWFDQPAPLKHFQHRWLEGGTASFSMRREPALHDTRPDAMPKKFAGGEQSARSGPHDQDGRCVCAFTNLTRLFVERGANIADARVEVGHTCISLLV